MKKLSKFISYYSPPILWALVIFIFSSQEFLPSFDFSALDFLFKKSAHMFVYAVLYFLVYRSVSKSLPAQAGKYHGKKQLLYIPILICLLYATSDEFHQSFVPGRYATIRDIGFDMLGVFTAFLVKYKYI